MLYSIQYLRGVAALLVVLHHISHKGRQYDVSSLNWLNIGNSGVDLFFIISGFIMCYTTHNRNILFLEFIKLRFQRILPLYWLFTTLALVVYWVAPQYINSSGGETGILASYLLLPTGERYLVNNGWPVVSPERYAGEFTTAITKENLVGNWEQVILGYRVVPGYDKEQNSPDFQVATTISLDANGGINGSTANTWSYSAPWLTMKWSNGFTDEVLVERGRDWENKKETILFSGLNNKGTAIWGKKK